MTPEESDIAQAIRERPAACVYRGRTFQVTRPQPKQVQKLDGADILDDPEAAVTALARDFLTAPKSKTIILIDGEKWRITDAQLDSNQAGYVINLQSTGK